MKCSSCLFDCVAVLFDDVGGASVVLEDYFGELGLGSVDLVHHALKQERHVVRY